MIQSDSNHDPDEPTNESALPDTDRSAEADGQATPRRPRRRRHRAGGKPGGGAYLARSQARVLALQALFEIDVTDHDAEDVLGRITEDESVPPPVANYALSLARGVGEHQGEIDPRIAAAAPAFPLPQVANVDRNVLRLAIYELVYQPDVPLKAAINEAVELAKRFGGPSSGRFVNGVLGTIAGQLERSATPSPDGDSDS
ncbi:MAG: transcription antitermination factor NusB [Chloroflexia bacterium]|nr:transcription antitermination factor NusB [Chloroflexia bacterium]